MMQCMACSNDTGPDVITDQTPPSPWDPIGQNDTPPPSSQTADAGWTSVYADAGVALRDAGNDSETDVDEPTGRLPDGGVDCSFSVDYDNDGYVDHRCGGDDCNDENPYIHPGANEACDNDDNNCDGNINEGLECWFYAHSSTSLYKIDPFLFTYEYVVSVPSLFDMDTTPAPQFKLYGLTGSGWLKTFDEDTETWSTLDNSQSSIGGNGFAIDNYGRAFVTKSSKLYEVDLQTGAIIEEWDLSASGVNVRSSGDCVVNKNNSFFMTSSASPLDDLIYVDSSTMQAVLVGNTGFDAIWGLTAAFGNLYGLTSAGKLLLINPDTAETVELYDFPLSFYGAASTANR